MHAWAHVPGRLWAPMHLGREHTPGHTHMHPTQVQPCVHGAGHKGQRSLSALGPHCLQNCRASHFLGATLKRVRI